MGPTQTGAGVTAAAGPFVAAGVTGAHVKQVTFYSGNDKATSICC